MFIRHLFRFRFRRRGSRYQHHTVAKRAILSPYAIATCVLPVAKNRTAAEERPKNAEETHRSAAGRFPRDARDNSFTVRASTAVARPSHGFSENRTGALSVVRFIVRANIHLFGPK